MFRASDHEGNPPGQSGAPGQGSTAFSTGFDEASKAVPPLPARPADGHKGTFGSVVVVGGCFTMPGAPALCAAAALRSGTGLTKVAAEPDVLPVALGVEPCATGVVMEGSVGERMSALRGAGEDAVWAVGPGWGDAGDRMEWVRSILTEKHRVVLDADGLNALAKSNRPAPPRDPTCELVLTPHPGEYRRLAQAVGLHGVEEALSNDRAAAALALSASHHDCVVVLKGRHTLVAQAPDQTYTNPTGSVVLATPGSGDVLTGLLAALLAQGMSGYDAARLATYLHGRAGERWHRKFGCTGMTARTLLRQLPYVFEEHRRRDLDDVPF